MTYEKKQINRLAEELKLKDEYSKTFIKPKNMKSQKIYFLQVGNIQTKQIDHQYMFTSKRKCEESKKEMIHYLNWNHKLNVDQQTHYGALNLTCLDNQFNVSITEHDIKKQVLIF